MFLVPPWKKSNCKERTAQAVQVWTAAYWVLIKSQETYPVIKYSQVSIADWFFSELHNIPKFWRIYLRMNPGKPSKPQRSPNFIQWNGCFNVKLLHAHLLLPITTLPSLSKFRVIWIMSLTTYFTCDQPWSAENMSCNGTSVLSSWHLMGF